MRARLSQRLEEAFTAKRLYIGRMATSDQHDSLATAIARFYRAFGVRYVEETNAADVIGGTAVLEFMIARGQLLRREGNVALTARALRAAANTEIPLDANEDAAVIAPQDLAVVTRRFLEEVLIEAAIPAELMDVVVSTYQMEGQLTMSEDGGRYIVHLRRPR
jgi:hypothetical protein